MPLQQKVHSLPSAEFCIDSKEKDKLKSFSGMASFKKDFIKNFSILLATLFHLTKTKVEFLYAQITVP